MFGIWFSNPIKVYLVISHKKTDMRKGKEILEELTDTEQLAFKINYLNERPDIKDYLKQEFPDRLTFYSEAFKWHSSKEGRFYWVDIAYRGNEEY